MFILRHKKFKNNWIEPTYSEIVSVKRGVAKTKSIATKKALELKGFILEKEERGEEKEEIKAKREVSKPKAKRKRKIKK